MGQLKCSEMHDAEWHEKRRAEKKREYEQYIKDNPEALPNLMKALQDYADWMEENPTTIDWLRGVMNKKQAEREKARLIQIV